MVWRDDEGSRMDAEQIRTASLGEAAERVSAMLRTAFSIAEDIGVDRSLYPEPFQSGVDFDDAVTQWSADRLCDWGESDDDGKLAAIRGLFADAYALAADLTAGAR